MEWSSSVPGGPELSSSLGGGGGGSVNLEDGNVCFLAPSFEADTVYIESINNPPSLKRFSLNEWGINFENYRGFAYKIFFALRANLP